MVHQNKNEAKARTLVDLHKTSNDPYGHLLVALIASELSLSDSTHAEALGHQVSEGKTLQTELTKVRDELYRTQNSERLYLMEAKEREAYVEQLASLLDKTKKKFPKTSQIRMRANEALLTRRAAM